MRLARQFLLIISLMFWQGGFMFYGGVVVPVGSRVLDSDLQQGFITQSVTHYLNLAGLVCLAIWAEHFWNDRQWVSKIEWGLLAMEFVFLMALVGVHVAMDQVLDARTTNVINPARFGVGHKLYIGISSLQWMFGLFLLLLSLQRWNRPT
jgi:hypothetical protein